MENNIDKLVKRRDLCLRNKKGQFIFNGGKKSDLRDKPCPSCGKMIMRKSKSCKSCWQVGERSINWKNAKPSCPSCNKKKETYSKGLCWECFKGENHFNWKGDNVGYGALHDWIKKQKGIATHCELISCEGISTNYQWANISGLYLRELTDWMQLCISCHVKFDKNRGFSLFKEKNHAIQ